MTTAKGADSISMSQAIADILRSDILAVAKNDFDARRFDDAVFEAFKLVESAIQNRIGSSAIGKPLMDDAFDNKKIDLPGNKKDLASMAAMFSGAVGYYRGDRAHGDEPSLPIRSANKCLRVLGIASALMDLLDADLNIAPAILSDSTTSATSNLRCRNLTPTTECRVNGSSAAIISRTIETLSLNVEPLEPGIYEVQLVDGEKQGSIYALNILAPVSPVPGDSNWYRVKTADVPVYADAAKTSRLSVKAVVLESYEGGEASMRCFPTQRTYTAGPGPRQSRS